jgi:hypothetical protein
MGFAMAKKRISCRLLFLLSGYAFFAVLAQGWAQSNPAGPKGNVLNLYGAPIGAVNREGIVYNAYGSKLGRVDSNGDVYNVSDIFIGRVYPNGDILNQSGVFLGYVEPDGGVYNVSDIKIGSVQAVGDLILSGGAARIILFRGSNSLRLPSPRSPSGGEFNHRNKKNMKVPAG